MLQFINPLNYTSPKTKHMVESVAMTAFAYAVVATSNAIQSGPALRENVAYVARKTTGIAANLYEYSGASENVSYAARKTTGVASNLLEVAYESVYPTPPPPAYTTVESYEVAPGTELQGKWLA